MPERLTGVSIPPHHVTSDGGAVADVGGDAAKRRLALGNRDHVRNVEDVHGAGVDAIAHRGRAHGMNDGKCLEANAADRERMARRDDVAPLVGIGK